MSYGFRDAVIPGLGGPGFEFSHFGAAHVGFEPRQPDIGERRMGRGRGAICEAATLGRGEIGRCHSSPVPSSVSPVKRVEGLRLARFSGFDWQDHSPGGP